MRASRLRMIVLTLFALLGLTVLPSSPSQAVYPSRCTGFIPDQVYHVGPGQPMDEIADVPFTSLGPGDIVYIHWRSAPYLEKIYISTSGSTAAPLCIVGVPNGSGELPIIDGAQARTSANMDASSQTRGLVVIHNDASYVRIEGLYLRNAHNSRQFFNSSGVLQNYTLNAAAIHIETGHHIIITGCTLTASGNGFFGATYTADGDNYIVEDITLEYSYIFGNGNVGRIFEHNIYTEAVGIIFQYNRIGPMISGAGGNALKDRSSGTIIRYNWIEGGHRQLDLVEAEYGGAAVTGRPDYEVVHVYGNVFVSPTTTAYMIHFGGDLDEYPNDRNGPLYFYHNTVIMNVSSSQKSLFQPQTNAQSVQAYNNLIRVNGSGSTISYMAEYGALTLGVNMIQPNSNTLRNFRTQQAGSSITGVSNVVVLNSSTSVGFVNEGAGDYHLLVNSPAANIGQILTGSFQPVTGEYVVHQGSAPRIMAGNPDLGAYEYAYTLQEVALQNMFTTPTPTLTWTRITWAVEYEVQVDDLATFASPTTYSASSAAFTLPNPGLTDGSYFWRVRGRDANGVWGAYSAAGTFVIDLP